MFKTILRLIPWILIAILLFRVYHLNKQVNDYQDKTAELSEKLKNQTVIKQTEIVYKYRTKEGTVTQKTVYVPVYGSINMLTPIEGGEINLSFWDKLTNQIIKNDDGSVVLINTRGFTFRPNITAFLSEDPEVGIGATLAFWNRYNAGIGFGHKETLYLYGGRNISDIFTFMPNTSAVAVIGRNLKEQDNRLGIGLSVNF
jgi:hypothetical protein